MVMSKLDTNHVVNLDLVKDRVNSVIKFGLADVETSDFYLGLYNNGSRVFDKDYIVTLYIVKPNGTFRNIELEPKEGLKKYYCNLPDTLKNIPGEYVCQAVIFDNLTSEKKISKSKFKYSVDLDLASEMAGIIDEEEQESILTNILNRLLTLENPVEPYATQKHVDECVSTLTEEIDTIKVKDVEQDEKLSNIETKNIEQDNRLTNVETKNTEQDGRLANIESKNTEQDNRLTSIESKNTEQDGRLTTIEAKDVEQDGRLDSLENRVDGIDEKIVNTIEPNLDNHGNRLDALEAKDIDHESRMTDIESKNTEQDERLSNIESKNTEQDGRLDIAENRLANIGNDITNTMQPIIDAHTSRLNAIEAIDVSQNNRLDVIEAKNQQQDNRLLDIEKVNKRQDMNLKCLFAESKNNMIDITEEGNSIYLQNSTIGYTLIDEIKGNTLVNCNKEANKELILNGNINTSGDNTVTLTEGVDGGLVDVALEGNTLVNVSKTKDSTAITKAYTVENSGNHIALQGDVDGSCRLIITGNTLWVDNDTEEILAAFDGAKNLRLQSTFEDNLVPENILGERITNTTTKVEYSLTKNIKPNTTYTVYLKAANTVYCGFQKDSTWIKYLSSIEDINIITTNDNVDINKFAIHASSDLRVDTCFLVEGDYSNFIFSNYDSTKVGKYKVDYKVTGKNEYTKTLYLNSPLLEGDTIEEKDNSIYHVHRSEKEVLDGDEPFIKHPNETDNTLMFTCVRNNVYDDKNAEYCYSDKYISKRVYNEDTEGFYTGSDLVYFRILKSKLSTLDVDGFKAWLQANPVTTTYKLTTPQYELIEQSNLVIPSYTNGHLDFNTAVPVEKVEFKPFTEELTYLYANTQYTVQFVSDRATTADIALGGTQLLAQNITKGLNRISITTPATLADNKLLISGVGAKISEVVVTDTNREFKYFEGMKSVGECEELEITSANSDNTSSNTQQLTHEPLRGVGDYRDRYVLIDGKWYIERKCGVRAYQEGDTDTYKTDLINTIYPLDTPIYEPIDYNPLEVYSRVTHITTNSAIPCNITVKNHGFNCLLKPSTTYTVSSNLGLNTVTTPSVLTEDCLRFMDTDTSDVTTMKDVLVLEGDWTTKADLIPGNFSGIESAFEQEYDAEKGKYKVNIKVANEDKSQENNITFYINEPLKGVGNVKDRVYVKDDKVVVQRNCGIRPYEDGDFGTYLTDKVNTVYQLAEPIYEEVEYNDVKLFIESFKNSTLFYNSNVPVTSKLYYSYSVPIVDTVAQTASISDEQDSMIIDLATQCAVMEMYLM